MKFEARADVFVLPADRRLAEAISLVRWMAERSVHLLSRKPFIAIFTHMTHLLVFSSAIFPPAALDYAKALRTLLSYPPHLETLDQQAWKVLMGVCWAAVLGDPVTIDDEWQDDPDDDMRGSGEECSTQAGRHRATVSQVTNELASLIPILLSSSAAPLIPALPSHTGGWVSEPSLGFTILLKIHRFFLLHPAETSAHLIILRSLNTVLVELELNCRADFVAGGMKLFPQLIALWSTRNKGIREQVLIALRTLLPYLTHRSVIEKDREGVVREGMGRLMQALPKEAISRWGVEPSDMSVLRLKPHSVASSTGQAEGRLNSKPFETRTIAVSSSFSVLPTIRYSLPSFLLRGRFSIIYRTSRLHSVVSYRCARSLA